MACQIGRRISWRRLLLMGLLSVVALTAYDLASLSSTAAKMLHHEGVFDWWRGPVSRSTIRIGSIPADIYKGSRSHSRILFVHGVNETGKDSPDIRPAAEAFAGSGFTVVVPDFVRLKRQNVSSADIEDVVFVIQSLGADIGIVCASYGCGPALIAAARPGARDRVRFVVTFGSYFDLTETLRSIVTGPPSALAYSKWIYLGGNVDLLTNDRDRQRLAELAVERRDKPQTEWQLNGNGLGLEAKAMLDLFESKDKAEFDQRLRQTPLLRSRIEELSPSRHLEGLRARLIIVHLRSDPSIPSSESFRMAEAAKLRGVAASLTILDVHGHTLPEWPRLGIGSLVSVYVPGGWKLAHLLNEILSYA